MPGLFRLSRVAGLGAWLAAWTLAAGVRAAPPGTEASADWLDGADATGDWNGARSWLAERGVRLDLDYTAEVFGDVAPATDDVRASYRGTLDLIVTLDGGALGAWPGGTLFVFGQHAHGSGVSEELGARMPISNIEARAFTQLSELWYEQRLFDDLLCLRAGKQDATRDFASPGVAADFVHSSFGGLPTVPLPTFPAPGIGAMLRLTPHSWLDVQTAVYEGRPAIESVGLDSVLANGTFLVAETRVRHGIAGEPEGALYGVGAWRHDSDAATGGAAQMGGYALVDLLLPLTPSSLGVSTFARLGWASPNEDSIHFYASGGASLLGLRAADSLGLAGGHARFEAEDAPRAESFIESFYKARFAAWLAMQLDLQLIFTPGGTGRTTWLSGLRAVLEL